MSKYSLNQELIFSLTLNILCLVCKHVTMNSKAKLLLQRGRSEDKAMEQGDKLQDKMTPLGALQHLPPPFSVIHKLADEIICDSFLGQSLHKSGYLRESSKDLIVYKQEQQY